MHRNHPSLPINLASSGYLSKKKNLNKSIKWNSMYLCPSSYLASRSRKTSASLQEKSQPTPFTKSLRIAAKPVIAHLYPVLGQVLLSVQIRCTGKG